MADTTLRRAAWLARSQGRGELSPFTREDMRGLAGSGGPRRLRAGTRLMKQGEPVSSIGLIERGQVELYRRDGKRRIVLQVLRAGDVLGDIPLFCRVAPPFGARALTDVDVIQVGAEELDRQLVADPEMCRRLIFSLASRLERMQRRLLALTKTGLRSQVAALLLDETGGEAGTVTLAQSTLAELLGATRPSVNRVLKAFEAEGLLRLAYRRVEVVDSGRLRKVSS